MILFNRYECEFPNKGKQVIRVRVPKQKRLVKKNNLMLCLRNPGQPAKYRDLPPNKREIHSTVETIKSGVA
jgi:hypothetical protein